MKETENSLSDQRLQNTMKDLMDAETEIKSLSKRQYNQDVSNGGLHKQIASRERANRATGTRKQQRRALKSVAMVLLLLSSLTAMCALVGCKMTSNENFEGDQEYDMFSSLGACSQHWTSQEAEKGLFEEGPVAPARKRRNLLDVCVNAIKESTSSSITHDFIQRKSIG
mmetsp:Transcript_11154/g.26879  ORF Transcript_11154/g.26879 Transcript_11154/m.26879 type:complete len:169 (+) Transcript_11154:66-572(+)